MRFAAVRGFLALYPASISAAVRRGMVGAAIASLLDFASLLLLFPVFTNLTSSDSTKPMKTPLSSILDLSVGTYIVLAMIVMIVRSVTSYALRAWWMRQVAAGDVALSNRLLSAYVYAPYEFHLMTNSAELMSRAVSNVNTATFAGLSGVLLLATDATTVMSLAAALIVASPLPGILVCAYLAVVGFVFAVVSRRFTSRYSREYSAQVTNVYQRTATVLRGVRELTVANARGPVLDSIRHARQAMTRAQRRLAVLTDVPRLTLETALYAAILVALLIVVHSSHPEHQLPIVALYVVAALRVLPAVSRALGTLTQIRSGVEIGRELGTELARLERTASDPASPVDSGPVGPLEVRDVSFAYGDGPRVLDAVSLAVSPGEFIGIVGPSGGGKSTLLNIVLGLLQPTAGAVVYAGRRIPAADPNWFAHVGYVPQESYMLDDSVLANVTLGQADVDRTRAMHALEKAGLRTVVDNLDAGLDAPVGENGSRLSVGQRQRLGLARALYRHPAVLILDEPTAALDAETERQVMESIRELKGQLTILMVTHRRAPLAGADRTYALDGGRLVQELSSVGGA